MVEGGWGGARQGLEAADEGAGGGGGSKHAGARDGEGDGSAHNA